MNKHLILVFIGMFLISLSFVSAESIGTFKQGTTINITNYCQDGGCTGIDLISIKYPNGTTEIVNQAMTMNGQEGFYEWSNTNDLGTYYYKTTGSNGITNEDSFDVTPDGKKNNLVQFYVRLFLILFSISLIILIQWNRKRINYEQWYSKMATQYQEKNLFKWGLSALGYNLMKNSYIFSYLIGLFGMLVLTEITLLFNITSALSLMKIMLALYSWAALAVVIVFFSQVQEWFKGWIKDIQDLSWGWEGMA